MPPYNKRLYNAFSEDEKKFIILKHGETQSITMVIRAFGSMFHSEHPRLVPSRRSSERIIKRFQSTANCQPRHPPGRVEKLDENVAIVRNHFDQNKEASVRMAL